MSRKISSSSEKPDMGKPKKKKKKKLLNSSFQESLHFFFYRFSFLAAAFVFSAQLNMISWERARTGRQNKKCWRRAFPQTMGTLSFMHTFRVNELFFLGGRRRERWVHLRLARRLRGDKTGSCYKLLGHVAAVCTTRKLSIFLSDRWNSRKSKHKDT